MPRLLSQIRSLVHEISQTGGLTPETSEASDLALEAFETSRLTPEASDTSSLAPESSGPTLSAQEEMETGPVSELGRVLPDIRAQITEAFPPFPSEEPPLGHEAPRPPSLLAPIPRSDANRDSAILNHSGPLKLSRAIHRSSRRFKRKIFPFSY